MLAAIPLMIVPLVLYNLVMLGMIGGGVSGLGSTVTSMSMMSGATWAMSLGDLLIVIALGLLFIEVLKATRTGAWSVIDHMLSMFVFVAFLVEFSARARCRHAGVFHPDGDRPHRRDCRIFRRHPLGRSRRFHWSLAAQPPSAVKPAA